MITAVLSDIHGNYLALEACLGHAMRHGAQKFVLLGDYIGEFPCPQRTMEQLYRLQRQFPCSFARGNKEDYWIRGREGGERQWKTGSASGALRYAYDRLRPQDIEFFAGMPLCCAVAPGVIACHATPKDNRGKMRPGDAETLRILEQCGAQTVLFGHTHVQSVFSHAGRRAANPGAVGVALHSGGRAQYLLLDGDEMALQSVEYDREVMARKIRNSELWEMAPGWSRTTVHLLQTGEGPHSAVLARAQQYCREQYGACVWPDIPEDCWDRALEDLEREAFG